MTGVIAAAKTVPRSQNIGTTNAAMALRRAGDQQRRDGEALTLHASPR